MNNKEQPIHTATTLGVDNKGDSKVVKGDLQKVIKNLADLSQRNIRDIKETPEPQNRSQNKIKKQAEKLKKKGDLEMARELRSEIRDENMQAYRPKIQKAREIMAEMKERRPGVLAAYQQLEEKAQQQLEQFDISNFLENLSETEQRDWEYCQGLIGAFGASAFHITSYQEGNQEIPLLVARSNSLGNYYGLLLTPKGVFGFKVEGERIANVIDRKSGNKVGTTSKRITNQHAKAEHNVGKYPTDMPKLFAQSLSKNRFRDAVLNAKKEDSGYKGYARLADQDGSFGKYKPEKLRYSTEITSINLEHPGNARLLTDQIPKTLVASQNLAVNKAERNFLRGRKPSATDLLKASGI